MPIVTKSQKIQGTDFPLHPPKSIGPYRNVDFRLLAWRTMRHSFLHFKPTQFLIFCYRSQKKHPGNSLEQKNLFCLVGIQKCKKLPTTSITHVYTALIYREFFHNYDTRSASATELFKHIYIYKQKLDQTHSICLIWHLIKDTINRTASSKMKPVSGKHGHQGTRQTSWTKSIHY